jgi:pSer/pThr/pTyr-binding forkhead associated (FHA) protein
MLELRLTTILSGRAIDELRPERFAVLTIGRSPECEVRLDNLAVSRRHAEVRNEEGVPVLVDLSGAGVDVNGARVRRHELVDGDLLTIGKFMLAVAVTGARAGVARRDALDAFVKDTTTGVTTRLTQPCVLFGRDDDAAFKVKPGFLAALSPRVTAAIVREDDGHRLLDLTGKGAVKVDGAAVVDVRLAPGDVIEVDAHRLEYGIEG